MVRTLGMSKEMFDNNRSSCSYSKIIFNFVFNFLLTLKISRNWQKVAKTHEKMAETHKKITKTHWKMAETQKYEISRFLTILENRQKKACNVFLGQM